jgi:nitric oxide reductase subunit B
MSNVKRNLAQVLHDKKTWWVHALIVGAICATGLIYLGTETYSGAPPLTDFKSPSGETVISQKQIKHGQEVFHLRGLMGYGSFWGDGAERGPDYTADALHRTAVTMRAFYAQSAAAPLSEYDKDAIAARVVRELKTNTWDEKANHIIINEAQIQAFEAVNTHVTRMFNDPTYEESFDPAGFISDPEELRDLAAFFFWGGWVPV